MTAASDGALGEILTSESFQMNSASCSVVLTSVPNNPPIRSIPFRVIVAVCTALVCAIGARSAVLARPQNAATLEDEDVKRLFQAARRGEVHAQFELGLMYETGESVAQDNAEAVKWYEEAGSRGEANAQF